MHCSQATQAGRREPSHLPAMRVRQQGVHLNLHFIVHDVPSDRWLHVCLDSIGQLSARLRIERLQGWDGRGGRSNLERDESTGITEAGSD